MPRHKPSYITANGFYDIIEGLGEDALIYLKSKNYNFRGKLRQFVSNLDDAEPQQSAGASSGTILVGKTLFYKLKKALRRYRHEDKLKFDRQQLQVQKKKKREERRRKQEHLKQLQSLQVSPSEDSSVSSQILAKRRKFSKRENTESDSNQHESISEKAPSHFDEKSSEQAENTIPSGGYLISTTLDEIMSSASLSSTSSSVAVPAVDVSTAGDQHPSDETHSTEPVSSKLKISTIKDQLIEAIDKIAKVDDDSSDISSSVSSTSQKQKLQAHHHHRNIRRKRKMQIVKVNLSGAADAVDFHDYSTSSTDSDKQKDIANQTVYWQKEEVEKVIIK